LRESMTHQAEQPNPAQPYVDTAKRYLQSGNYDPAHLPETQPADYLRELSRNPDILAKNIDQASNFNFVGGLRAGGRSIALKGSAPSYVESKWADPATNARLIAMDKGGATFDEIAAAFGVSRGAVAGRLDRIKKAAPEPTKGQPSLPRLKFMERPFDEGGN
jgi:hypothetical protein